MPGPIAEQIAEQSAKQAADLVELQNSRAELVKEFGSERAAEIEERVRRYYNKPDEVAEALREELDVAVDYREWEASRPWQPAEMLEESDWIATDGLNEIRTGIGKDGDRYYSGFERSCQGGESEMLWSRPFTIREEAEESMSGRQNGLTARLDHIAITREEAQIAAWEREHPVNNIVRKTVRAELPRTQEAATVRQSLDRSALHADLTTAQSQLASQYHDLKREDFKSIGEYLQARTELREQFNQVSDLRDGLTRPPDDQHISLPTRSTNSPAPEVQKFIARAESVGHTVDFTYGARSPVREELAQKRAITTPVQEATCRPDPTAVLQDRARVLTQVAAHPLGTADTESAKGAATNLAMDARAAVNKLNAEGSPASLAVLDGVADDVEDADFELEMKREELARTAELIGANHSRSFQAATAKFANGVRSGVSEIDLSQDYQVPDGLAPADAQRLIARTHSAVTASLAPLAAQSRQDLNIVVIAGSARLAPSLGPELSGLGPKSSRHAERHHADAEFDGR